MFSPTHLFAGQGLNLWGLCIFFKNLVLYLLEVATFLSWILEAGWWITISIGEFTDGSCLLPAFNVLFYKKVLTP